MPSIATPTARTRSGSGLDKTPRRRAAKPEINEPTFTIAVKEALDNLAGKVDKLAESIHQESQLVEKRLSILEQNAMLTEQHAKILESIQKDFSGYEQRFRDHERNGFHQTGEAAITKLLADVENLKTNQLTQQAVKDFTDEMMKQRKDDRRWLIGVSITMALFVLRELMPAIVRTAQAMPTPVMP